ncbi:hypothetical protein DPEC_G00262100 [Dallia pectoralis]|uniref:Uncharacterized protein n=1 Tax=Dallia pectoralis TaxID=75939 RepID=A0ACC2FRY3_DALPE|nr:hypothetical protein DPEC_G00262100 [Dallia pectoralis]
MVTRTIFRLSCVFILLCLGCVMRCSPVTDADRNKADPDWRQWSDLLKDKREAHQQDTVKNTASVRRDPVILATNCTVSKRRRCGVPDYPTPKEVLHVGRHRKKRFVLFGGRLEKADLTYKVVRLPRQMGKEEVRHVLLAALRVWSEVTPLTFTEVIRGKADIVIDFNRYWHGDNLPFDGPGGILAHAFFPKTHREGNIHFDYDEEWTSSHHVGTDLLQVAVHEFGHVLGLQHSLEPGAVMSPYYSSSYPLELSEDDKLGIQYLYGPRPHAPPPTQPPPQSTTEVNEVIKSIPDACQTDFDAVSMIRGELFFFKSRYVWRIREGRLEPGYPTLASRHWKGIPEHIDAAFEDQSGNIWFFQGQSYWMFDAEKQITGPDSVQSLGLSVSNIQATLLISQASNYNTYIFKVGSYWRFSPKENRLDSAHPRSIQDWNGIPTDLDAAFQDRYGYANFIRGRQYWKVDPVEMNSLQGYPRFIGTDFFGCKVV